jgi:hypothetical protein
MKKSVKFLENYFASAHLNAIIYLLRTSNRSGKTRNGLFCCFGLILFSSIRQIEQLTGWISAW